MKIESELSGDLEIKAIKKYGESKTRMATARLNVEIAEKEAIEIMGEEFHRIAFGGMLIDPETKAASFTCERITKPNLVCERHEISLLGHTTSVVPEIPNIRPVDGDPLVIVEILLPLACEKGQEKLMGDLAVNCGEVVVVDFKPAQLDLPGTAPRIVKKDGKFGNVTPMAG